MSQLAPSPQHKRFAGQVAWERGQKIVNWPSTSSALSGLIQKLIREVDPLPAAEWQVDRYRTLVADCVAKVEDFDVSAYAEVPGNRADANKAIFALQKLLNRTDFRSTANGDLSEYVVSETADDLASAQAVAADANTMAHVESSKAEADDEIPF